MENNENKSKYNAQIKHIQRNYKKFHIDFRFDVFNKFQDICKKNNTTPTTVIKQYVTKYINENS